MVNVQFEGDLNDVSEKQLQFISDVLNKNGFDGAKVTIKVLGAEGDNYMASVKRIVAEKDGKVFKMVAKIAPTHPTAREANVREENVKLAFINEDTMYNKVLPKLREYEISNGVPESDRYKYAECYGSLSEDINKMILLEDLSETDFAMLDRFKSLTDESVRQVLIKFAKLHAFSYALKRREPEVYENFASTLLDLWNSDFMVERMEPALVASEKDIIAVLNDKQHETAIKGSISKLIEVYRNELKYDKNSKFWVILHADAWTNNIMFRMQEGTAVDCCMIDYQMSRAGNPVGDLMYFIFNCTDYETRKAHFHDWMDFYHSELDKNLFLNGLRANHVYSKDQLEADLKRYSKIAFAFALLVSTVLIRANSEATQFKSAMEGDNEDDAIEFLNVGNLQESSIALFITKVTGVINSFHDLGYVTA